MAFGDFFYRQRQRFRYHATDDPVRKRIAEINRYSRRVVVDGDSFLVKELALVLPGRFGFVFQESIFDVFLRLPELLQGVYHVDNEKLYFRFGDLNIEITSKSDLFVLNEVFVDRCYRFLLPFGKQVRVVDMGMNVGIASLYFAGLECVSGIYGYEPFPETFKQAQVNFGNNPARAAKIQASNFGLGLKEENVQTASDVSNSGRNTSVGPGVPVSHGRVETIQIKPAISVVQSLLDRHQGEDFALKIDTEGAEYPILDSLFSEMLSDRVRIIMLEWHYRGAEGPERILLKNGFSLTSFRLNANTGLIYAFR